MMPSDPLREEIEKAMREAIDKAEAVPGVLALTATAHPAFDAAVSVAEELVQREITGARDVMTTLAKRAEVAERERDQLASDFNFEHDLRQQRTQERDEARKALAEYREKWGHAPRCFCDPNWDTYQDDKLVQHGRCDPRCAPEVKRD